MGKRQALIGQQQKQLYYEVFLIRLTIFIPRLSVTPYLFRALDPKPDMAVGVANGDKRLEARSLPCPCLFLDRHDLQNLVLQTENEKVCQDFTKKWYVLGPKKLFVKGQSIILTS
jgi:hypothetical protein